MIEIIKPIGHCFGALKAIATAKETKEKYVDKNVYVFGLLVHNEEVIKLLDKLDIKTIEPALERLKEFTKDDVVIFTAHGHTKLYEDILKEKGVTYIDTTCPRVNDVFNKIKENKEIIYIGKKNHPEVNAALAVKENILF